MVVAPILLPYQADRVELSKDLWPNWVSVSTYAGNVSSIPVDLGPIFWWCLQGRRVVLLLPFCRGGSIRVLKLLKLQAKGCPCLHRGFLASPAFAIRRAKKAAKGLRRHTTPRHATQTPPKQQRQSCYQILQNFFFPLKSSQSVWKLAITT